MEDNQNIEIAENKSESKIEKIDMKAVKFEQDRTKFFEKTEQMLNDVNFIKDCNKYLEIKKLKKG